MPAGYDWICIYLFLTDNETGNNSTAAVNTKKPGLNTSTIVVIIVAVILFSVLIIGGMIYWATKKIIKNLMSIRIHPHGDGISFDEPEQREGKIRNQWANEKKILHMGYILKNLLWGL